MDDSASVETVLAFEAGIAEALAQGLIEWVPRSERFESVMLFRRPSLGKLTEPSLYALPRDKIERKWKPPTSPVRPPAECKTLWRHLGKTAP